MLTTSANAKQDRSPWLLLLVSLSVVMGFQVVRVLVTTLVYDFGEDYGQTLAALPALLVFLSPFLTPLVMRILKPQQLLPITAGGLALIRVLLQLSRDANINLVLSGLAVVLTLMAFVVLLRWLTHNDERKQLAQGILLGMTIESALHGAFLTWDYVWQPGIIPLIITLVMSALAVFALWKLQPMLQTQPTNEPSLQSILPIIALGPFFMFHLLFLQNIAYITSSSSTSMELGLATVLVGNAIGLLIMSRSARVGLPVRLVAGVLLVVMSLLLPVTNGLPIIIVILVGHALMAGLLPSLLAGLSRQPHHSGIWRTTLAVSLGSLVFALLTILYYISALITFPFTDSALPPVGAIIILVCVLARPLQRSPVTTEWRYAMLPLILLVLPLILTLTRPSMPQAEATTDSFRMVNYNIHQAINVDGWLDPEAIAQVIEAQQPTLLTLQEISRGWLIAGSLDVAEWLSRRLEMPYVYAPGHDYQFGNIIMSRMPITDWSFERLPLEGVPMRRSVIRAEIDMGNGNPITIINTHLSAYATTEARIPQVEKVIDVWNQSERTIIAGDMNAHAGDDDIVLYLQAGLTSAQDATGNPDLLTFSSFDPVERIDWIFGTAEIQFSNFEIPATTASDHLPLAVTVNVQ
jgi:endonuclease/exonuclease/phosphatase family metal-dependent hydrolase